MSLKRIVLFAICGLALPAQQDPEPAVIRMDVNLVQVDAVVTDGKGRHVADLRPADFEVRQDGKAQEIAHFLYIPGARGGAAGAVTAGSGADAAPPRVMALVVDDLALSHEGSEAVKQALFRFVEKQMRDEDRVALIRTGAKKAAVQFSGDRAQLRAAVKKLEFNFRNRVGQDSLERIVDERSAGEMATGRPGGNRAPVPFGDPVVAAQQADQAQTIRNKQRSMERDALALATLESLRQVLRIMAPIPGRKSAVVLSENLSIPQKVDGGLGILENVRGVTDLATRAGVVFYTVDPRGVAFDGFRAEDQVYDDPRSMPGGRLVGIRDARHEALMLSRVGLGFLASETGGLYLGGVNDVGALLGKAVDDQGGYYLIGYRPSEGTFQKGRGQREYHSIQVRVLRDGLQARSRRGFFNVTDDALRDGRR